jgi:hypothetical protein
MGKVLMAGLTVIAALVGIVAAFPTINQYFFPGKPTTYELINDELLVKLFNAEEIDSLGLGKWTFEPSDSNRSEDIEEEIWALENYFYTRVEKTFRFSTTDNKRRAIVIFATYRMTNEGKISYGHIDRPLISFASFVMNTDETWTLTRFSRHSLINGTFGRMQEVELKEIGKEKLGLFFTSVYVGSGSVIGTTEIYDSEDFHFIFSYNPLVSHEGFYNFDLNKKENDYRVECEIVYEGKSQEEYFPFCLRYSGKFPKDEYELREDYGIDTRYDNCYTYDHAVRRYEIREFPGEQD